MNANQSSLLCPMFAERCANQAALIMNELQEETDGRMCRLVAESSAGRGCTFNVRVSGDMRNMALESVEVIETII